MKTPSARRNWWLKQLAHVLVLAIVLWFVHRSLREALDQIGRFQWRLEPAWLVFSGLLYLAGLLPMGLFWRRALVALGQHPQLGETLRAFYVGHLGKYAPGKALVVILRTGLIRGERVGAAAAAASVFLETLTMMAVGAFLAAGILATHPHPELGKQDYLVPLAIGLMLLAGLPTLPPVFRRLALRLGVGRADPSMKEKLEGVTWPLMLFGWIGMACGWVLLGLSLWATLKGMGLSGLDPLWHLNYYLAAVGLAMVAGFLSLIPGGAVVRELILTAILGVYFSRVIHVPLAEAAALAAAVVLRLVWLLAEISAAAFVLLVLRPSRKPG